MSNKINGKLEKLEQTRKRVRADINKLMRHKDYYTNDSLYKRVSALTGLETYLTYCIEKLETKIAMATLDDYYM